jgi:predicted DNA-binding transcriptional regulator AlpA
VALSASIRPYRQLPRASEEFRAAMERILDLTAADQLRVYDALRDYLGVAIAESDADRRLTQRLEALSVLEQARDHLGLSNDVAPTMAEFDRAADELGLDWNAQRVARAFGGYKIAASHLRGERSRGSGLKEGMRRAAIGRARTHEDYVTALRIWLATEPNPDRTRDYDAFARDYNSRNDHPLPLSSAVKKGLTLFWVDCLRVARRETTLAEVAEHDLDIRETRTSGPHDLIGLREIGLMHDLKLTNVMNLSLTEGFPPPALILADKRTFLREHVAAHQAGRRQWEHKENFLRPLYYDVKEMAAAVGIRYILVSRRLHETRCPPRTGVASGRSYWLKSDVETWIAEHRALVDRRLAERARASAS